MQRLEYEIDDTLMDGSKDEIKDLKCECGGKIYFKYSGSTNSMRYWCNDCHTITMLNKIPEPNCFKYFGETNVDE